MSLPRFFKFKKAAASLSRSPSDPNLSDSSSTSSEPKDALGFPIPVTITTVIPASAILKSRPSASSTPSPVPHSSIDMVSSRTSTLTAALSAASSTTSSPVINSGSATFTNGPDLSIDHSRTSSPPSTVRVSLPKSTPSRSSGQLWTTEDASTPDLLSSSCPQLISFVSTSPNSAPPLPTRLEAMHAFTVENVSGQTNTARTTMGIGSDSIASENQDRGTIAVSEGTDGASQAEPDRETEGSLQNSTGLEDTPNLKDVVELIPVPPTPRIRSQSIPHRASVRPVSILKNKPKSILRSPSRSGGHPASPPEVSSVSGVHDSILPAFPAPPKSIRMSMSSDTSSRSSVYLHQDPMAEGWVDDVDTVEPSRKVRPRPDTSHLPRRQSAQAGKGIWLHGRAK